MNAPYLGRVKLIHSTRDGLWPRMFPSARIQASRFILYLANGLVKCSNKPTTTISHLDVDLRDSAQRSSEADRHRPSAVIPAEILCQGERKNGFRSYGSMYRSNTVGPSRRTAIAASSSTRRVWLYASAQRKRGRAGANSPITGFSFDSCSICELYSVSNRSGGNPKRGAHNL
jgi:hypothetical protein